MSTVERVRAPRFVLLRGPAPAAAFADDVRRGLTGSPKSLPPRWFYDDVGSALFDAICFLPEYYVMRAEAEVLREHAREIAAACGEVARIIELGSGAARKTRILFDALPPRAVEYVPVDVDAAMLERSSRELLGDYAQLRITALCADFTQPADALAHLESASGRTLVLFLGSTIGNLDPDEAASMLRGLRASLARGDALLLGADLRKPRTILEPAYDDALGVTAAFNRNLLQRMNRELDADFDLGAFAHLARYDEALGRIEMHLVSERAQRVRIGALDLDVDFARGESIHTESSYKHDEATLRALADASGFSIERRWSDARGWFADVLLVAA
ncbi:MAG TPA: L-histidine N(alpha)-methyltransferase [Thermoanaerobaculia bacterium]|jgi:L-histidine N-alpha-methyltransferase